MLKRALIIGLLLVQSLQSEEFLDIAAGLGSTGSDIGLAIVYDSDDNVIVGGSFRGTIDFDLSANVFNLTSNGNSDFFVAKYDPDGAFIWAISGGGIHSDPCRDMVIDSNGDVIITGLFNGIVDFDPSGSVSNLAASNNDGYLAKYDGDNGSLIWAIDIGGTQYDEASAIDIDDNDNIYVTGNIGGTTDFDVGPGSAVIVPSGGRDAYLAKYDNDANYIWAKVVGGVSNDYGIDIIADDSYNVYVIGQFQGDGDYDPSAGTATLVNAGGDDIFLAKYNSNGDYLWANSFGSASNEIGSTLAVDNSSNILISGYFNTTVDFDPSANTSNLTSAGSNDIFFGSYNPNGALNWVHGIGSTGNDVGRKVYFDEFNNIYITGQFTGTVDFDPSANTNNLISNGGTDVYVASYNTDGDYIQSFSVGGGGNDVGYAIQINSRQDLYLTGSIGATTDFDTGSGVFNVNTVGSDDIFYAVYNQSFAPLVGVSAASDISQNSASSGGTILNNGNEPITQKGIIWGTNADLSITNFQNGGISENGTGNDSFKQSIGSLSPATNYYIRAYATNSVGTGYSSTISFNTRYQIATDGNQDGILDSLQTNVHTLLSLDNETYITIISENGTQLNDVDVNIDDDPESIYPFGLLEFKLAEPNAEVEILFHGIQNYSGYTYRKKFPDSTFAEFSNYNWSYQNINGRNIAKATLSLTDGGLGDFDGVSNGIIYDPGGPAIPNPSDSIPMWEWWHLLVLGGAIILINKKYN